MPDPLPAPLELPRVRRAPSLEPPTDDERPALRLVPAAPVVPDAVAPHPVAVNPVPEPLPRPARAPVDPAATVGVTTLLLHVLEVQDGRRSPQQLRALLPPALLQMVTTRARVAHGRAVAPGRLRRPVHVQAVSPTVVEANGLVVRGPRAHAVAARVELVSRTWRCTALWLG